MAKFRDDGKSRLASHFIQLTPEESGGVHKSLSFLLFVRLIEQDGEDVCDENRDSRFGILLYGEGIKKVAYYNRPPTLLVNGQPIVLPEPDGMLHVLGPMLKFQRVEVRVEKLEHFLDEKLMHEFHESADWTEKLQPVLEAHEWSDNGLNGTPKAQP
jgi:hypothetical protein